MIRVNNVVKTIENNLILDDACMNVPKGSIYGLVGPNGAGKSTIIRCITGAYQIDSGEILVGDEPVYENPEVKSQMAYIPDDIFYHMTDNITGLMKFYKGLYPNFDEEMYAKVKEIFPALTGNKLIRSYSKGMQRQVAFLLSLCIHPKVMVLDEPLDGLDPVMRRQVLGLIVDDVAKNKTTVVISSHNLRELEDICDHVGIMENGKIVLEKSLSDLQGSVLKVQIAFETSEIPVMPNGIEVLHKVSSGKVHTLIVKGDSEETEAILKTLNPVLMDVLPLTLEEIFVYEMGGAHYGTKHISEIML